jgi:addiction module HigA family antidote
MAIKSKCAPLHPGEYVRQKAITPKKLSVTEAAKHVGVGRPAFSNFLNGKADVTPEMAARVERAFGIPAKELLDQQATFDAFNAQEKGAASKAKRYVPPFLGIKGNEIEEWAKNNISARTRLAVFLRTLVNSTGIELTESDFPGNDDGERAGWDGYTEAGQGTSWIPAGKTGWEFGVNEKPKPKADKDFTKSVIATPEVDRLNTTFVFVTPRKWDAKDTWAAERRDEGVWKDVRAYDRSDLEQWLEQSIPAQAWFANETGRPESKVRSLDKAWRDWTGVATPPMSVRLFDTAIDAGEQTLDRYLSNKPSRPLVIVADSTNEALAYLSAQISSDNERLGKFRDRVVIFDQPGVFEKLASTQTDIVAVASSRNVEREIAQMADKLHTIVVYPRNASSRDPDVVLEPLNSSAFEKALSAMDKGRDEVQRLEIETGRSLTVLRRRLSTVDAIRKPEWAEDEALAANLVPFVLVGAWDTNKPSDREALSLIANSDSYEMLEKHCHALNKLDDAPVWMVGSYRGLVAKIDALFAVNHWITVDDLRRFFDVAKLILGEHDPALDLPEEDRWLASIRGKTREFSEALRRGISETLVLLAVHGNGLFRSRLGIDCEVQTTLIVRELLTSDGRTLDARKLEANERDLPTYAEAAPDEFLSVLERDLRSGQSAALGLMRPSQTGVFGSGCARTGLLWALEGLAWSPETFPRTVHILARLSEVEIDDNWANKPINSLRSIFRSWMPQTAATVDQRIEVLKGLAGAHPRIAWQICVAQFDNYSRTGDYSHKPTWRPDGFGYGEPERTWKPIRKFVRAMVEMALLWPSHDHQKLGDLVERVGGLNNEDQQRVWLAVADWASNGATDEHKAWLREKIRVSVMSWRASRQNKDRDSKELRAAARVAYDALEPSDLLAKHEWLFRNSWVEESAEELEAEEIDFRKRDERVAARRADALREIKKKRGIEGILELASMGEAAWAIGWLITTRLLRKDEVTALVCKLVSKEDTEMTPAEKQVTQASLHALEDTETRAQILNEIVDGLSEPGRARLLKLAPFDRLTWRLVDGLEIEDQQSYWLDVIPSGRATGDELPEGVDRLIKADRPRAAFAHAKYQLEALKTATVYELLSAMARNGGKDKPGEYQLSAYEVTKAFELIEASDRFSVEQKAQLEFAYLDVLSDRVGSKAHGIPNLEKYIQSHPEFFVQAVSWAYKRDDKGEDDELWRADPDQIQFYAERGYKLLEGLEQLPGYDHTGKLSLDSLKAWVHAVREAGEQVGRLAMTDLSIGKLFSASPEGEDGVWPCEEVRDVLELVQSESMCGGLTTGKYNRRGVVWRGEGGQQERDLAQKFKGWANALRYSHPFTAANVLDQMADSYTRDADWQDSEAGIRRRLH